MSVCITYKIKIYDKLNLKKSKLYSVSTSSSCHKIKAQHNLIDQGVKDLLDLTLYYNCFKTDPMDFTKCID